MSVSVLPSPMSQTGGFTCHPSTMEHPDPIATVDRMIATVESTDEARTVPQDVQTVASPHVLTLWYPPDTPAKLADKLPSTPLQKRGQDSFVLGRAPDVDVLLNDEHMSRYFAELFCRVEGGVPRWYVKNLSDSKSVRLELGAARESFPLNQVRELQDGHRLKLETLWLTAKTEGGDCGENTDVQLEFRASGSSVSSSGSYRRQTSSSTDSSGSVFSASEAGRQAWGGSPVQNGQYMALGPFGQGPRAAPLRPGVYAPGQAAPVAGMAVPGGGGGGWVYYPSPAAGSLPGFGPQLSAGPPTRPRHSQGTVPRTGTSLVRTRQGGPPGGTAARGLQCSPHRVTRPQALPHTTALSQECPVTTRGRLPWGLLAPAPTPVPGTPGS